MLTFLFVSETPLSLNRSQDIVPSCHEVYGDTSVHYAFMISAVLIFTATLGYIFLYCKMSHVHAKLAKLQKAAKDSKSTSGEDQEPDYMPTRLKGVLLVLLASLMMSYCVMEDGFASFLMTFSLSYLKWDKETGAVITTVFWALFVLGRFSGIFLVSRFKQKTLLTTYLILITLSILGFLLAAVYMVIPLLWVFTGMLGFSMSVVFPCIFGWTSENIMQITGKISAMFLVSAGLGAMLYPLLVGYLMEFHSPMWFVFMLMITMVLTLTIYGTIRLLARICIYRKSHDKHLGKEMTVLKPRKDESR